MASSGRKKLRRTILCFAAVFGWLCVLSLIASLFGPRFWLDIEPTKGVCVVNGNEKVEQQYFWFHRSQKCINKNANCTLCDPGEDDFDDWYSCVSDNLCFNTALVYTTSFSFSIIAIVVGLTACTTITLRIRGLPKQLPAYSPLRDVVLLFYDSGHQMFLTVCMFVSCVIACLVFLDVNRMMDDDNWCANNYGFIDGVCGTAFTGTDERMTASNQLVDPGGKAKASWGPSWGWIMSVLTMPLSLITFVLVLAASRSVQRSVRRLIGKRHSQRESKAGRRD
eukprot:TRINITY_DN11983_c0_g1_i1.p1 TRINITY_DN11983_c0_g1~~TRINITY_DN11983_c0_g1_i1.p1  ORF type:complete len:280 (+),score=44.19 TRINITY_DN11983_c0_g1_i1:234-1073(+)